AWNASPVANGLSCRRYFLTTTQSISVHTPIFTRANRERSSKFAISPEKQGGSDLRALCNLANGFAVLNRSADNQRLDITLRHTDESDYMHTIRGTGGSST